MYLICGEALFDFFLTKTNEPGSLQFDARAGGSPFNVAIGIVRQGGRSGLLTGMSNDLLGARLAEVLQHEGVETSYLVRSGRRTTLSLVDLSKSGVPEYAFYGLGSADCNLSVDDLPVLDNEILALHFGSYSIAVEPVCDAFAALAERERHRFISLDPNVRPTVVDDPQVWQARIERLLPFTDLVKVSAEDLEFLFPDRSTESVARDWLDAGPELVVVTEGPESVRAFRGTTQIKVVPPSITVVDTVGAGDAFQATLLARLSEYGPSRVALTSISDDALKTILVAASEVAAATCQRRGADIPSLTNDRAQLYAN